MPKAYILSMFLVLTVTLGLTDKYFSPGVTETNSNSIKLFKTVDKNVSEQIELEKTIIKTMLITKVKMRDVQKAVLASTLASIAMKSFRTQQNREAWVSIISIESSFDSDAESPMGGQGLGQVTWGLAKDYREFCGLGDDLQQDDLYDVNINATLSACIFNDYIQKMDGYVNLAAAAYNAGIHSKTVQKLDNIQGINKETANYISKLSILLEKIRR